MRLKNDPLKISLSIPFMLAVMLVLSGCDLERIPEADLSDEVYWQSQNDFRQAANYLYQASRTGWFENSYLLLADQMSDDAMGFEPDPVSNGSYLPGANFGPWDQNYRVIRAANNLLEKASESSLVPAEIAPYVAEAHFFRAFAYGDLLRRYGGVPLIVKTLDTDDEELYAPRAPREEVADLIYQDLDLAAAALPDADSLRITGDYGRVTRGTALALKSRIALREGTWNKFHDSGPAEEHLQAARAAAQTVIESGQYDLFNEFGTDSYYFLFKNEGEGPANREAIWTYVYGFTNQNSVTSNNIGANYSNGAMGATRSLVDAYLCTDGLPIDRSPLYQGQQNAVSEYQDRDPRLDGAIVKPGDIYFVELVPYIPQIRTPTGYHIDKYFAETNRGHLDHMVIRYAEVLLNYAEATYELNGTIPDQDLDISINLLRDRVGMPHLTNAFVQAQELDMREEIRRERRVELALEGFRYDDLLRWKTAQTELPKPILGVRFFAAEYPANDPSTLNLTPDSIVIAEPAAKRNFDPAKQYLWPLPLNQLGLNPNLEQNPNW